MQALASSIQITTLLPMTPTDSQAFADYKHVAENLSIDDFILRNEALIYDFFLGNDLLDYLRSSFFCKTGELTGLWHRISDRSITPGIYDVEQFLRVAPSEIRRELCFIVLFAIEKIHSLDVADQYAYLSRTYFGAEPHGIAAESPQSITARSSYQILDSAPSSVSVQGLDQKSSVGPPSPKSSERLLSNSSTPDHGAKPLLIAVLGLIGIGVLATAVQNPSSESTSTDTVSADTVGQLASLESSAGKARLICESQPLIDQANSLNIVNDAALEGRRGALIQSLKQKISALNVPGKDKYTEDSGCTHGWQWFDKHGDDHWRAFVAISDKCPKPMIHYSILPPSGEKVLSSSTINLSGHSAGEVKIPYPDFDARLQLDRISCW